LKTDDFVYLHVEASDEAGHDGDIALKIKTIENLDKRAIGIVYEALKNWDEPVAIAVLPDHPTPCLVRTHTNTPVPFLIYKPGQTPDAVTRFDEFSVLNGKFGILQKDEFIKELLS
jgi:2,3-bisphosphoglycerate-independent phosphoglycerate mutase